MTQRKRDPGGFEQAALMTLTDLEQVKVLADPLRVRIMELFCRDEYTTKQVAEALDEKPTKLYHHVDALEKVGLIRQTRTRRNRGTLERYYIAVARAFRADSSLFDGTAPGGTGGEAIQSIITTILANTGAELRALAAQEHGAQELTERGVLSYCEIQCDSRTIRNLERRVKKLVEDLEKRDKSDLPEADRRRYRLTLAFYPLDRSGKPTP